MKNLMQKIKEKTTGVVTTLGLAGLLSVCGGCDQGNEIKLKEMKIYDSCKIELSRREKFGSADDYILSVYKERGELIARMSGLRTLVNGLLIDEKGDRFYTIRETKGDLRYVKKNQ